MKKMRFFPLLLALVLALVQLPAIGEGISVAEISKYGNLVLNISGADFMAQGYDYGDIISAEILGREWTMPVGNSYSDVDAGGPVCRVEAMDQSVVLAINMGNFAEATGVAGPGERVLISMREEAGYREEWIARQLVRTNERADYAHLTDAEFANFRMIDTAGVKEGVLWRSSSPVNPELGRSAYADASMEEAGIRTVINLADDEIQYPGWQDGYYASCAVACLGLGMDVTAPEFGGKLADGLRFLAANEGPFLLHCTEGKDRAGFVSALLECLMGASAEEVVSDYMESYYNYYGVQPGTGAYEAIADSNIRSILSAAFKVADISGCDLSAEAREYLEEASLSPEEIDKLMAKLAG